MGAYRPSGAIFTVTPINPKGPGVTLLMGEDPPRPTVEHIWTVHGRPRRKGVTEYEGRQPGGLVVSACLSYADVDRSIETLLIQMEYRLSNPVPPRNEPPVLQVNGPGIPPLVAMTPYVLERIDYNGEELRLEAGPRSMAFFSLVFLEYVPSSATISGAGTTSVAKSAVIEKSAVSAVGRYTVKSGDTLETIAARQLGSPTRWHEIANLNGIRDPRNVSPGDVVKLP